MAIGISVFLIYALPIADYLADWSALADIATGLAASLSFLFIAISTAVSNFRIHETGAPSVGTHPHPEPRRNGIVNPLTALMLAGVLGLCSLEWYLHRDDRNPFLASSRPEANEDTWLTADGYAMCGCLQVTPHPNPVRWIAARDTCTSWHSSNGLLEPIGRSRLPTSWPGARHPSLYFGWDRASGQGQASDW
ncbi:MAG: hypothetical protein EBT22_11335 [Chloroflexi bacterium]|nr:hypothetical protein [Chloroflexota bacterium]